MNASSMFGKPSTERQQTTFKKPWRLQDNSDNIYGILPQFGSLKDDPYGWNKFHRIHWGYEMRQKQDPSKTFKVVFHCIQKKGKGGMIIQDCPQCTKYDTQEAIAAQRRSELEAIKPPLSKEEINTKMNFMSGWLRAFSPENKVWMNVMNQGGEFGYLGLSYKVFQQLKEQVKKVEDQLKINPIDPSTMVMWNIHRTGSSKMVQTMSDSVTPHTITEQVELANGEKMMAQRIKVVQLTDAQLSKAMETIMDLGTLDITVLTYEQIQQLADSEGEPEVVEAIFNQAQKRTAPAQAAKPVQAPVQPTPAPYVAPAVTPHVAAPVAAAPVAQASIGTSASLTAQAPAAAAPADSMEPYSEEEMMRDLGIAPSDLNRPSVG